MPQFENVGKLLHAARRKLGISQEQSASALDVKLSRLQKWESGMNGPRFTIPELRRLREANREVFDAMMSGFLLVPPPGLKPLLERERHDNPARRHQPAGESADRSYPLAKK